ncbi:ATP-binding protein [Brevundimonas naejangsanensis]|uniref:ATP-binding protein n=2 Tax=Brevundimonas naejangsanensis TaxID=588932 RepID=UPI000EB9C28C|nr:ATP-binding protein [Brevundimonas naejangsanensis]HAC00941.1 two-component sensor histidine kinase [Brevundimonas sp.]HCW49487.1 two-component sensor histidine kinase [Brevundimonas sp.]
MNRPSGLGRKIALRMVIVAMCGFTLAAFSAFFIYNWVFENYPGSVAAPDDWIPHTSDYLVIVLAVIAALAVAVFAGMQLARGIVLPLHSLAQAARSIADGDLKARASVRDGAAIETTALVADFNHMAAQLEALSSDMVTWNAAIAHELRTPVTILKGRLQGVSDGVFEMDAATLSSLLRQIDGLARLVEDLRVVSLADSGRLGLQKELVDLAQVVGELKTVSEPALKASGFRLSWRLTSVMLMADPTRLRQAVLALVENARIHATPSDLAIEVFQSGDWAVIRVADSGPGVPPGAERLVFQAFQRKTAATEGSGLGLAVVRAIAQAHDGQAEVAHAETGGAVFSIKLPL